MTIRGPHLQPWWPRSPWASIKSQDNVGGNPLLTLYAVTAPRPFVQYDWPNPTGAAWPIHLRSWASSYNGNLVGQDVFYGAPGQSPAYDMPVPIQPAYFAQWRTWTWAYNSNLIGQDKLPFRQQDWPLPTAPSRSLDLRAWASSYVLYTPAAVVQAPFNQTDWPLPTASPYSAALRTWISILPLPLPPPSSIVGRPPLIAPKWAAEFPVNLRTWTASYNPNLVGQDQLPNRQQDWPVPTASPWSVQLRGWTWAILPLLTPSVGRPFVQFDWPLPGQPAFPIALRSWTWSYGRTLIGQDKLPNRQQDWPVPVPPAFAVPLRSWAWSYNLNLVGKDQLPTRQQDWPLATAYRDAALRLRIGADIQPDLLLRLTTAPAARPFVQTDWALSAGYPFPMTLRASFGPNLVINFNSEWLIRARRRGRR